MEKNLTIDVKGGIAGILAIPDNTSRSNFQKATASNTKPAIIFAETLVGHQSGASRVNTDLARILVDKGYPSLRYSAPATDRATTLIDALNKIGSELNTDQFVIIADGPDSEYVLQVAEKDGRIKGLYLRDVTALRTRRFHLYKHILFAPRRLLHASSWTYFFQLLKHKISINYLENLTDHAAKEKRNSLKIPRLSTNELRYLLWSLFRNNICIHFAYTGSAQHFFNHAGQFEEMIAELTPGEHVSSSFLERADYQLIDEREKVRFISQTTNWVCLHFPELQNIDISDAA